LPNQAILTFSKEITILDKLTLYGVFTIRSPLNTSPEKNLKCINFTESSHFIYDKFQGWILVKIVVEKI
jgi:hypothetical protein